jgi:hypothetical protein
MKILFYFLLVFALTQIATAQSLVTANTPSTQNVSAETDSCGLHLAEGKLTPLKSRQIQICLKQKGYYKGIIGNELNADARAALLQYQIDNHLPQGNLNLLSLRMLGRGCKCGE